MSGQLAQKPPAGERAALRLKQTAQSRGTGLPVCCLHHFKNLVLAQLPGRDTPGYQVDCAQAPPCMARFLYTSCLMHRHTPIARHADATHASTNMRAWLTAASRTQTKQTAGADWCAVSQLREFIALEPEWPGCSAVPSAAHCCAGQQSTTAARCRQGRGSEQAVLQAARMPPRAQQRTESRHGARDKYSHLCAVGHSMLDHNHMCIRIVARLAQSAARNPCAPFIPASTRACLPPACCPCHRRPQ